MSVFFIFAALNELDEVIPYLQDLSKDIIYHLGLSLGLVHPTLQERRDSSQSTYLSSVLVAWLRGQDHVLLKSGSPTWSSLVRALRDKMVRQNGIANKIETEKLRKHEEEEEMEC